MAEGLAFHPLNHCFPLPSPIIFLGLQGLTLLDQLAVLYTTYGYHASFNSYYICRQPAIIEEIFSQIRNVR